MLNGKETIKNETDKSKLFIRIYQSKKTGKTYYGTVIDNVFYFVHIKEGTNVDIGISRLDNRKYIVWTGLYDLVNTEKSKDIFIGYKA